MGEKVVAGAFDLSDRQHYRDKLRRCLAGLERLLAQKRFDRPKNLMGLEIELNLARSGLKRRKQLAPSDLRRLGIENLGNGDHRRRVSFRCRVTAGS